MDKKYISKNAIKQVLKDYWQQVKIHPWQTAIMIFAPAIGSTLIFYVPPLIIGKLIDSFLTTKEISISGSLPSIAFFGFVWILGEVFWRLGLHFQIIVEERGINALARQAFAKLSDRDYEFYSNNFVGTLVKKATAYSRNYESLLDTLTFNVSSQVFPIIFVIYILWGYSPWLPIILLGCLVFLVFIAIPIIKRRLKLVTRRHDAQSNMVGILSDSMTNILAVKSFAQEKRELKNYGKAVDRYSDSFLAAANFQNLKYDMVVSPIYVMTNVIGLVAAIYFGQALALQAGAIVVVYSYYAQVTRIFWNISGIYRGIESSVSEAAEFTQLFIDPPMIQDLSDSKELEIKEGNIEFKEINFNYCKVDEDDDCFLSDFNLLIKKNQKVGLVGPSGGGKTTITKLLLRFIDPQSGEIQIDGQDIKKVTQTSLRENISYVPQEPLLFHRSLFENIAYGNVKATKEEIIDAAKLAHADEFISKLPEGYDTLVGERGIKLSGGQRQRVAIARALLKKSPILILDEATSSLDSESEKYIQEGLLELMKDKTALVIAHRLSTIKHLDRILVLDDGAIVEDGTHDELIEQDGLYAKLWKHQAGETELMKI